MRFVLRSLMGLFLLAVTLGILAVAGNSLRNTLEARWSKESTSRPQRERVFGVDVVTAEMTRVRPVIETFGEIKSRRTLDIRAPMNGTVIFLSPNFTEGGEIQKGDLLLKLDPADAESSLSVARTDMAERRAERIEADAALILAGDELVAAQEQEALRVSALERQQELAERGVGTAATVETAALAAASAKQATLAKRQAEAQAKARVSRAVAAVSRQEIRLAEAERALKDTEVFAEFNGVISSVTVVEGGLVSNNERIGRLIDPSALEVVFRVSNTQFARLTDADVPVPLGKVHIALDILGEDVSAEGTIERVGAEVGAGLTGRQIFARLPEAAGLAFRPGDFVSVSIEEPELRGVIVLPATAVDSAGMVLVLGDQDRLEDIQVTVLRNQGETVLVRNPELRSRKVVSARSPLLGAGIRVKPLERQENQEVQLEEPDLVELDAERRAKLVAFVEANGFIPNDVKQRLLERLQGDKVPGQLVRRLESRMGG